MNFYQAGTFISEVVGINDLPLKVKNILDVYFEMLNSKLSNPLEAFYIYGSLSLDAFKYGLSDIDFAAVLREGISSADLDVLKKIHADIRRMFPKVDLSGIYVMENDLESTSESTKPCPRFIDGKLRTMKKFNKDTIDAYQLKKYGIAVKGKEANSLSYITDWDILIANMKSNLNTYWQDWKNGCEEFLSLKYIVSLFSLRMIQWGVLGVSRLYYTFRERDIISKAGAGEYALKTVPKRWHRIINESLRLWNNNKKSCYKSIFKRRKDALMYMEYIIEESNRLIEV